MAPSARQFATLLQTGITAVAKQTAKPKGVIRDELGYAIGRKGGSAIEYWVYGDGRLPSRPDEVAALARILVAAGELDREWLVDFLDSAGYPHAETLLAELFPTTTDQPQHNLPLPPTPFVGRARELDALDALITNPDCRLITLVGPGGSGKSRLAVEAARAAHPTFADGVAFVALAPLTSAEFVVATVATTLNFTLSGHAPPQTQLLHYLRRKTVLLVLDNFEHLLSPPVPLPTAIDENRALALVNGILQEAPTVMLLITSRERLNLQGEWVYDVGGLEIPDADGPAPAAEASALTLFRQTARRVQASFTPTPADQAAIIRICQQVAGMPLALELAAAWVRVLSCHEIAEEIAASLDFLTATLRNLPDRHQSMQAVFDHSWKLLSAEEQEVFACCSVFRGGFTREAAAQITGATLPLLTALVDKSLLSRQWEGRYTIHELARQYAAERLVEAHQVTQTRNRHLAFFLALAETAEPQLHSGAQVAQWHDRLESEHDNIRAAMDWALTGGGFVAGLRMVGALWEFWMNRGYASEGQAQAERFLARPEAAAPTYTRAKALHTTGVLAFYEGRHSVAATRLTECIALSRGLGAAGQPILALALVALGYTSSVLHNFAAVQRLSEESLTLGHALQDVWVEGHALQQLGIAEFYYGNFANAHRRYLEAFTCFQAVGQGVMCGSALGDAAQALYEQGDYAAAQTYLCQSLTMYEEIGDKTRSSIALRQLSTLALAQGNVEEAQQLLTQAFLLVRETTNTPDLVQTLDVMGRLAQHQGDYARAYDLHRESLILSREISYQSLVADSLEAFACLAATQGQAERAATLFGAAEANHPAMPEQTPLFRAMRDPGLGVAHEHWVAHVRAELGADTAATAWTTGHAMELAQAVAYALAVQPLHQQ